VFLSNWGEGRTASDARQASASADVLIPLTTGSPKDRRGLISILWSVPSAHTKMMTFSCSGSADHSTASLNRIDGGDQSMGNSRSFVRTTKSDSSSSRPIHPARGPRFRAPGVRAKTGGRKWIRRFEFISQPLEDGPHVQHRNPSVTKLS
jgi:hypothetical protein